MFHFKVPLSDKLNQYYNHILDTIPKLEHSKFIWISGSRIPAQKLYYHI